ncbi:TIM23 complex component [Coemansia sp. RSA 1200]|nr:TIM23 complex component [Coemansia sp. RSA 1200]
MLLGTFSTATRGTVHTTAARLFVSSSYHHSTTGLAAAVGMIGRSSVLSVRPARLATSSLFLPLQQHRIARNLLHTSSAMQEANTMKLKKKLKKKTRQSNTPAPVDINNPETLLNWEEFFLLRQQRRMWERFVSLPCALVGLAFGAAIFAGLQVDPQQMFYGYDPLIVFAISAGTSCCVGFALGPTVGRWFYRKTSPHMHAALKLKEAKFFKHIEANRSDPSYSRFNNPLPDFYGEKIDSVYAYRKWLRKQRDHEKKGMITIGLEKKKK